MPNRKLRTTAADDAATADDTATAEVKAVLEAAETTEAAETLAAAAAAAAATRAIDPYLRREIRALQNFGKSALSVLASNVRGLGSPVGRAKGQLLRAGRACGRRKVALRCIDHLGSKRHTTGHKATRQVRDGDRAQAFESGGRR